MKSLITKKIKTLFFSSSKDKRLRRLIKTYSDSYSSERLSLRNFKKNHQMSRVKRSEERFKNDLRVFLLNVVALTDLSLEGDLSLTSIVSALKEDKKTCIALQALFCDMSIVLTRQAVLKHKKTYVFDTSDSILTLLLDQVIEEGLVPHFYDFDYIDDIVPIVKSRYQGKDGTTIPGYSNSILQALWVLCERKLTDFNEDKLSDVLRSSVINAQKYSPKIFPIPNSNSISAEKQKQISQLNAPQNPDEFLKLCGDIFNEINSKTNDGDADREVSILYGYETNHHLNLRTLVQLISKGSIPKKSMVLIIGPRHPHEIFFFRDSLGLTNTIGLDLVGADDVMIAGDMHDIPFSDETFNLVYFANTLPYAYNMRQVLQEINRVLKKPGFIIGFDRCNPSNSPHPLGRSDVVSLEAALAMYYEFPHVVLAADPGLTDTPEQLGSFPSYVIELL